MSDLSRLPMEGVKPYSAVERYSEGKALAQFFRAFSQSMEDMAKQAGSKDPVTRVYMRGWSDCSQVVAQILDMRVEGDGFSSLDHASLPELAEPLMSYFKVIVGAVNRGYDSAAQIIGGRNGADDEQA